MLSAFGPLETLGSIDAFAFDKTGTLTEGKPKLTDILPADFVGEEELLTTVIAVEKLSNHPLQRPSCETEPSDCRRTPSVACRLRRI